MLLWAILMKPIASPKVKKKAQNKKRGNWEEVEKGLVGKARLCVCEHEIHYEI